MDDFATVLVVVAIAGAVALILWYRDRRAKEKLGRITSASAATVATARAPGMSAKGEGMDMVPESSGGIRTKTSEERKAILAQAVANTLAQAGKWRVESQSDYNAVIVKGKPVNHVLHLILTIVTVLFWVVVWIGLVIFGGETRYMLTVDEYGNTSTQKL